MGKKHFFFLSQIVIWAIILVFCKIYNFEDIFWVKWFTNIWDELVFNQVKKRELPLLATIYITTVLLH